MTNTASICPELLQEFLKVALSLAGVDQSINDAKAGAPPCADTDASKWHDVSLRALSWTRSAMASKQDAVLKQMLEQGKRHCMPSSSVAELDEIQSQAKTANKALGPLLSAEATPFRPGPPGVWILPNPEAKASWTVEHDDDGPKVAAACAAAGLKGVGSLREDLLRLREYDADCCLIVRRIKRLGLQSADLLREHFARFGNVAQVLVAHSFEKKSAKCRGDRVRPAALGFIIMEDAAAARAAISAGPILEVADVQIDVKKFEAFDDGEAGHEQIS